MSKRLIATICMLLLLQSMAFTTAAAPQTDGSSSTITQDETWSNASSFNGSITIAAGATLTIANDISVETGSSITVSSGAALVIESGSLEAESEEVWLAMDDIEATLEIPLTGTGGEVTIALDFRNSLTEGTLKAGFNGSELQNVSGEEAQFTTNVAQGTEDLSLDFEAVGYSAVMISSIDVVETGSGSTIDDLRSLTYNGMKAGAVATWSLSVSDGGSLSSNSSSLTGLDMSCLGICTLESTTMQSFEPIDLGVSGNITLVESNLNGSITDEDIKGLVGSTITWDAQTEGTGGHTDRWIKEIESQTFTAPLEGVTIQLTGLGYYGESRTLSTGTDGTATLQSRIVEWMDSSGTVSSEDASITSTTFTGASASWGTFTGTTGAIGTGDVMISMNLPSISMVSLEVLDASSSISSSVDVKAVVKNDGEAATIRLTCTDSSGGDVSTSPNFIPVEAGAGAQTTVEFTWTHFTKGAESITCSPVIPSAFDGAESLVLGATTSSSSGEVAWEEPVDPNEGGLVTWILVAIGVGIGGLVAFSRLKQPEAEDVVNKTWDETPESEDENSESEDETPETEDETTDD